jgi:hypothetical protein
MAQIVINEISQNYTYNTGNNSFATVALPITASWGPAFVDYKTKGAQYQSVDDVLEETAWQRFPSTRVGLESFVSTYRGPAANYRLAKDYSYQMAMTLITAGYDVLVCRLCPGSQASGSFKLTDSKIESTGTLNITAKYPGTFGNNLRVKLSPSSRAQKNSDTGEYFNYWNLTTYVVDSSGVQTAAETLTFVLDINNSNDTILHISELESDFLEITVDNSTELYDNTFTYDKDSNKKIYSHSLKFEENEEDSNLTIDSTGTIGYRMLSGGTDKADTEDDTSEKLLASALSIATERYTQAGILTDKDKTCDYIDVLTQRSKAKCDKATASTIRYNEWLYTSAYYVYELLKDKLSYSPQRIISPGWDDQNISSISGTDLGKDEKLANLSPLHIKLMEVAYYSRCATALLDIPRCLNRGGVYNDDSGTDEGYAQKLSRYSASNSDFDVNGTLYSTHSALFAPWGKYTYVGTSKQNDAPPSFLALLIQRAMLLNQSTRYEWLLPDNRQHSLKIGKLDYKVPKHILDEWQTLEGVGVNVITQIPDLGVNLWGNSTLYEVPPATYQALANLSTRYLVNAVENIAYKCGISITFQYNNEQAYNKFYAGVTPTLDTMKNVGAIDDYYVRMSSDINGLDQVNANTVIGKIYLVIDGVINDIYIDLIALPPGTDLEDYKS